MRRKQCNLLIKISADQPMDTGKAAVVKNGYLPERTIQTGLEDIEVKQGWEQDYRAWNQRNLSHKRYVYVWADETGRKELLALPNGYRESAASWEEVLIDLQQRDLKEAPGLAVGDGDWSSGKLLQNAGLRLIRSVFATVRLRTNRIKNCGSRITTLAMAFKLIETAQKKWFRLRGYKLLAEVIQGIKFVNGVKQNSDQKQKIA